LGERAFAQFGIWTMTTPELIMETGSEVADRSIADFASV
jgi:hypothetical protein